LVEKNTLQYTRFWSGYQNIALAGTFIRHAPLQKEIFLLAIGKRDIRELGTRQLIIQGNVTPSRGLAVRYSELDAFP
jgi:hypothetical protein